MKPQHYHHRVPNGTAETKKGLVRVWVCKECGVVLEGPDRDLELIVMLGRTGPANRA